MTREKRDHLNTLNREKYNKKSKSVRMPIEIYDELTKDGKPIGAALRELVKLPEAK